MTRFKLLVFSLPVIAAASFAMAGDLPKSKQTEAGLYVTAVEAGSLLEDPDVFLVDIRSRAEVAFLGLPKRADKHIPYMVMPMFATFDAEKGAYALEINPDFPAAFKSFMEQKGAGPDTKVILMCRSGSRSARAADLLAGMGFTNVYSMSDGFEGDKAKTGDMAGRRVVNGWRNAGLDWSYKIRAAQVYDDDR
mgnify:CR=1 FL=1